MQMQYNLHFCPAIFNHKFVFGHILGAPNLMVAKTSSQDTKQDKQEDSSCPSRGRTNNQWVAKSKLMSYGSNTNVFLPANLNLERKGQCDSLPFPLGQAPEIQIWECCLWWEFSSFDGFGQFSQNLICSLRSEHCVTYSGKIIFPLSFMVSAWLRTLFL